MISDIHALLENRHAARLPILFWRPQNTTVPGSTYTFEEQFNDPGCMLHGQLEEVLLSINDSIAHGSGSLNSTLGGDYLGGPLCIRPNFGTILLPAVMGLPYRLTPDAYPWLTGHLEKSEISRYLTAGPLSHAALSDAPMMQRACEYISYFRERIPPFIHVYLPDTQGPFDLAHLIMGDQLFLELYDDPPFVHEFMQFCTDLYIDASRLLKQALDEPETECWHGHALIQGIHMRNGGVRISEDTATLLSPDQIDTYVIPYDRQALEPFGGGFVHYCGSNDHLLQAYLDMEGVRAINFGNPEQHPFAGTMRRFREAGVCCFGQWPVASGESPEHYFRRIGAATEGGRHGLILHLDRGAFPGKTPEQLHQLAEALAGESFSQYSEESEWTRM